MKKTVFVAALVLGLALVFACKTTQPKQQMTEEEKQFKNLYDRYSRGLILDGAEKYTVVSGDTLSRIARAKYRDGFEYPLIMLASRDVVLDPDKIEPGMELTVPNLQKNLDDAKARANLKEFLLEIAKVEDSRNRHDTAEGIRAHANAMHD